MSKPLNKILEATSQLSLSIGLRGFKKKSKAAEFKWNMMQFRKDFEKGNGLGFLYYCTANIVKKFFCRII